MFFLCLSLTIYWEFQFVWLSYIDYWIRQNWSTCAQSHKYFIHFSIHYNRFAENSIIFTSTKSSFRKLQSTEKNQNRKFKIKTNEHRNWIQINVFNHIVVHSSCLWLYSQFFNYYLFRFVVNWLDFTLIIYWHCKYVHRNK